MSYLYLNIIILFGFCQGDSSHGALRSKGCRFTGGNRNILAHRMERIHQGFRLTLGRRVDPIFQQIPLVENISDIPPSVLKESGFHIIVIYGDGLGYRRVEKLPIMVRNHVDF